MGKITREFANTIGLGQTVQTGLNFRNYIINGDMNISQRGTSFTGLGNGDSAYTLDRWKWTEEGTITNEWTISQASDAPSGSLAESFSKSLKIECTTADASLDADSIQYIEQRVEAQNLQNLHFGSVNARNLNLAFWVKSNKTGTYTVNILNEDAGRSASRTYTIDSADTWIKKDINFGKDTVGAINNDNGVGLILQFNLAAGTNKSSGSVQSWAADVQANRAPGQVNLADDTANEFYLTGVQLERGKFDTDFETLPYDVTLRRCERYYYKTYPQGTSPGTPGWDGGFITVANATASYVSHTVEFPGEMRTKPTITSYSGDTGTSGKWYSNTTPGDVDVTTDSTFIGRKRASKYVDGISVGADKYVGGHMTANAEL